MVRSSKIKLEKYNSHSFELWKLKIKDLFIEKIIINLCDPSIVAMGMALVDWMKLDWKDKIMIWLFLLDSMLLNVLA
jgi:hypothetical protein